MTAVAGTRRRSASVVMLILVAALVPLSTIVSSVPRFLAHNAPASSRDRAVSHTPATPALAFELNQGQTDSAVRFLAPTPGGTLFLTGNEMLLSLTGRSATTNPTTLHSTAGSAGHRPAPAAPSTSTLVHMRLLGGAVAPEVTGRDPLATSRNYMVGDRSHWHLGVPTYARVVYHAVYPGIDLVYHGETGHAEYDFDVAPGTDPRAIVLSFAGQQGLRLDASGNLVLDTPAGSLTTQRPRIYQQSGASRTLIPGDFRLLGGGRVAFGIGAYDTTLALVIDPVIAYSTYIGGTTMSGNNEVTAITVDSSGNVYAAGGTQESDFPATTQLGPRNTGQNAYVLKLNPAGSMVVWSTVFGGGNTQGDNAEGVAVDPSGNVWVTGFTHSTDFPTTPTAFKPARVCNNPICPDATAFVTELNPMGVVPLYSTYLGGAGRPTTSGADQSDLGVGITTDAAGKAYVVGQTGSPDFPTTTGAFQSTYPGSAPKTNGFVAKLDGSQAGSASLVYSTFLGGSSTLTDSTGGTIRVDASGNAWVTGVAESPNFPTTAGAYQTASNGPNAPNGGDGFVTGLNAAGSSLVYSTLLGGTKSDGFNGLALGPSGSVYVVGATQSSDFPTTAGAFSRTFHGGSVNGSQIDGTFSVLSPGGRGAADLTYSTYLGGNGDDQEDAVVTDSAGNAYIYGDTKSSDWPLLNPLQGVWEGQGLAFANNTDLTVAELHPGGAGASDLLFSTYLGGTADEVGEGMARSPQAAIYLGGRELPPPATPPGALPVPYPTTRGAFLETWNPTTNAEPGFVTKLDLSGTTALLAVPGSDGSLWTKSDANPYQGLGGVLVAAPSLVAVPGASGALPTPLFIAVGSDHNLYVRSLTQGWQTLSSSPVYCIDTAGATVTTSTTGSTTTSTLTVACQGSDHGLWYAQGTVTAGSLPTVSGWQGLGGTLSAGPAVGTVAGNLTFLVLGSNGQVYSRTTSSGYTATGWGCIGHVALASYRSNAYFACQGGDHALWYSVNPGSGWVQVQSAGGTIADSPAIVATPAEVIVYVEGSNKAVYHVTLSPGGGPTTPWVSDGGSIQFGPGATTLTP